MRRVLIVSVFAFFTFLVIAIIWRLFPFGPLEPGIEGFCSSENWCWQNPFPYGGHFSSIQFMDEENGLIVGFNGTVFRTSDGGETWEKTDPPVEGIEIHLPGRGWWYYDCWDLRRLHFVTDSVGWAVGRNGAILKTTNGGSTWISQHPISRTSDIPDFKSLFFINELVGWAVGHQNVPNGTTRVLKYTTDGGETWNVNLPGPSAAIESLNDVVFSDEQNGWAVGKNGVIIHTTNGGQNWQTQDSGTSKNFLAITFIDGQSGWIVGENIILHTQNGGDSWQVQKEGEWTLSSVAFGDDRTGLAVGSSGVILLTVNAGNNWIQVGAEDIPIQDGYKPFLRHVIFRNNIAWAVGYPGCILRSEDSGIHWTNKGSTGPRHYLKRVRFVDADTGWALSNHLIMRTVDGGKHWSEQFPRPATECDKEPDLDSMSFVDADYGWAVCQCITGYGVSKLLHTIDGGQTWAEQYSAEPALTLNSVFFIDRLKGWITGKYSYGEHKGELAILHTSDGGASWVEQYRGTYLGGYLYEYLLLFFVDSSNGWLIECQSGNKMLHTNDGGSTWYEEEIQELSRINVVSFISPNEGWVFGRDREPGRKATLLHTTDGGQTWEKMEYETKWDPDTPPECMHAIECGVISMTFIDKNRGWLCGYNGLVMYTTDGGSTWIHQKTGTHEILWSIAFVNADSGWVVGTRGTILHHK
jgi:photosystem II stability/assembly factor-like uncharacterized protein